MNVNIKKFDPSTIGDNRVLVFIGKRGTGKTTLVTDILYHKKHLPVGIVMSGTEEGNSYYQQFIPDLFVYNEYDPEVVDKVISRQKGIVKKNKDNSNVFVLLDDCMYDKRLVRDKGTRAIFMNGRHWNIFFMLTMQYCMDLSPDLRANVDYVFILRENIIQNREKIFKHFFGIFPNYEMFSQVLNSCTENYECLVLDNTSKSNKIEDVVFWYKAKIRPSGSFRVGSPKFWACHNKRYNPDHDDTQISTIDPNSLLRKKNSIAVNVKKSGAKKKKNTLL
jgi:molybdopterin-guanine dinucleotide biosynthesis protein